MTGIELPIEGGAVRDVTVRELTHKTTPVLESTRDGERLIVTRHGDPQLIAFTVRDAVELVLSPHMRELADVATVDVRRGDCVALWPGTLREVLLAKEAADVFVELNQGQQGLIKRAVGRLQPGTSPVWTEGGRWLIGRSTPRRNETMVHSIVDAYPVEEALIGDEIHRARNRRLRDRGLKRPDLWELRGSLSRPRRA